MFDAVVQLVSRLAVGGLIFARLLLASGNTRAAPADPWWGRDKALHFSFSAGIGAGGYGATALLSDDWRWRLLGGALLGLTAGVAKEARDAAGPGDSSWRDFTWDVIGTATGVGLAAIVDWWCCAR